VIPVLLGCLVIIALVLIHQADRLEKTTKHDPNDYKNWRQWLRDD
jgi:hypothetical protein